MIGGWATLGCVIECVKLQSEIELFLEVNGKPVPQNWIRDPALCINNAQHINGLNVNLQDVSRNVDGSFEEMAIFGEKFLPGDLHFLLNNINLVKPTGHVIHHQFNIQKLYTLPKLYLYVLYLSENKQRLVPLTA
jgi:hypothetical protein